MINWAKKLKLAELSAMLFNFFPQAIIVLALLGIIIVFARKKPIVLEQEKKVFAMLKKIDLQKYINLIKKFLEKFLIKAKKYLRAKKKQQEIKKEKKSAVEAMIEEQKYVKILSQDPKNIFAYYKLGKLYLEQKNYEDAKAVFEQVLKIEPKNKKAKEALKKLPK